MNAKELMTGFYVRLNKDSYFFKKGQNLRVLSIAYYKYLAASVKCQDASGYVCMLEIDNLDPIPLTLDILKAYGFTGDAPGYSLSEKAGDLYAKQLSGAAWQLSIFYNDFFLPMGTMVIFHVHQLQQWLRLCGIEKEIKMSSLTSIDTI